MPFWKLLLDQYYDIHVSEELVEAAASACVNNDAVNDDILKTAQLS